jgi:hypothetical protein
VHAVPTADNWPPPGMPSANPVGVYASHRDRYDDADRITDQQADTLYPSRTEAEAEARRRAAVDGAAGPIEDLGLEELHAMLFGDTTGDTT